MRTRTALAMSVFAGIAISPMALAQSAVPEQASEGAQVPQQAEEHDSSSRSVLGNEIVVTAQRREEAVNDVGIAISAFGGDQIKALGFASSTDIVAMTPGVFNTADTGAQNRKFNIRGVSQNDYVDSVEAPIAVYVDDGYIAAQQGQAFGLFDIERVEILKGPQGTLFGRNATGGLVHFITTKPEIGVTEGFAELSYGSYDAFRAEAGLTVPINDMIAARFAGFYSRSDNIVDNLYPQGRPAFNLDDPSAPRDDLQGEESWGARAHLLLENDDGRWLLSGYAGKSITSTGAYQSEPVIAVFDALGRHINTLRVSPDETRQAIGPGGVNVVLPFSPDPNGVRPVPGGDLFGYRDPDLTDHATSQDFAIDDFNRFGNYGATSNAELHLSDTITLTSITDWKKYTKIAALDAEGSPTSQFTFFSDAGTQTLSQELRLNGSSDRLDWVAGLYYLDIANDTRTATPFLSTSYLSQAFGPVESVTELSLDTKSYSAFAQAEYDLTDQLSFILGGRIIREMKDYSFAQNIYLNQNDRVLDSAVRLAQGTNSPVQIKTSNTLWAGKVQLNWRPTPDILAYAGISRGVKAGSFSGPTDDFQSVFTADDLSYGQEVLLAYEAGLKVYVASIRTQINGSVYYCDYQDYQGFTFRNITGIITNNDARVIGGELDITSNPVSGLDLQATASVVDAKVFDLEIAPGLFRDVEPVFTPKLQLSGLIRYSWDMLGGEVAAQFDGSYASRHFYNLRNFDAHTLEARAIGNVRLSWENADRNIRVTLSAENVWNEDYGVEQFDLSSLAGAANFMAGPPRKFRATVRYSF